MSPLFIGLKYVSLKDVSLKDVSLKDVVVPKKQDAFVWVFQASGEWT